MCHSLFFIWISVVLQKLLKYDKIIGNEGLIMVKINKIINTRIKKLNKSNKTFEDIFNIIHHHFLKQYHLYKQQLYLYRNYYH